MPSKKKQPQIPLPKSWDKYVKSGILCASPAIFWVANSGRNLRIKHGLC